ncbi:MAG: bifunctional (p)ppGpp synthetase/guanosine-3',5'-bis(diphosphate) 3'-pyrophosphohydrolase, partial [Clostridia bacterium]|nr:bifunctional (p)ppGpp synthetase/guanosine-3',5'-bis(diphosphate) 3'-pyrophosphohydrolase [Clostridia bacterium]
HCTGARVISKIVPLMTVLQNGDVVEVITSPNSKGPSRDWLKFVKSPSAKAKIKSFFKNERKEENVRLGQAKLEEEAKKRGYALSDLLTDESFKRISERFSFNELEEMYASVGYGSVSVNQVLFKLIDFYRKATPQPLEIRTGGKVGGGNGGGILINGQSGMLVRIAGCCTPVPGDEIIGFTTRGRGTVVHRADCPNMRNVEKERLLPAEWMLEAGAKKRYNVNISLHASDHGSAIAVISQVVADLDLSITAINGRLDKNHCAVIDASISIADSKEVDLLIKKLQADNRIYEVHRITSLS